jgi:hypothetical protein
LGCVVQISGANESDFNGDFRVKSIGNTTSFTFDIVTAETTATGTIISKVSPLGFEKQFSGTNLAVYRSPVGNRRSLRVDDTLAQEARVRVYASMTGVSTGTGETAEVFWRRSTVTSALARDWWIIGTDKFFYFMCAFDGNQGLHGNCFGDFFPLNSADIWNTLLIGQSISSASIPGNTSFFHVSGNNFTRASFTQQHPRNYRTTSIRQTCPYEKCRWTNGFFNRLCLS